jgi:hypothetical protein
MRALLSVDVGVLQEFPPPKKHTHSLCLSLCVSLSFYPVEAVSFSLCPSVYLSLCLCISVCVSLSLCHSVTLSLCLVHACTRICTIEGRLDKKNGNYLSEHETGRKFSSAAWSFLSVATCLQLGTSEYSKRKYFNENADTERTYQGNQRIDALTFTKYDIITGTRSSQSAKAQKSGQLRLWHEIL